MNDINQVKERLRIFFKGDERMVEHYVQTYGSDLNIKHINAIRDAFESGAIIKENPIYELKVICPVCRAEDIVFHELKAKSLVTVDNKFLVPSYKGTEKFETINFSHWAVTVCPKCLFASPDKHDFISVSGITGQKKNSKIPPAVCSQLLDTMGERLSLKDEFENPQSVIHPPRDWKSAVDSYRLALARSNVEIIARNPWATYKKSGYYLKIALLQAQNGVDDTEALTKAASAGREAFMKSDFPNRQHEYRNAYILSAINLRLDRKKECREFIAAMDQMKTDLNPNIPADVSDLGGLESWIDKAKNLWEDRDYEGIWDLPDMSKA